ncbi:hypothetical protein [Ruicaihuangia caeni]|uniref:GAF domain-containing protein n=1 Tax=Ruicaihuangia caeni TaxID=3042517 RepID=A0AAW6T0Q2_9MICO|nr:hypothetical protein [Klugiella sp. YN-L-19]MDI2097401.1 hypothetical protein [Klugiella sp. YN-L-19]
MAVWLRDHWVLTGFTLLGSVVAIAGPVLFLDENGDQTPEWRAAWVYLAIAAGVAVVLDRIADTSEARHGDLLLRAAEDDAERSVLDLNTFLEHAIEVAETKGAARERAIQILRKTLASVAARAVGVQGGRASFFPLTRDAEGWRTLGPPVHGTAYGRSDTPMRPFIEKDEPEHPIWKVMDGPDNEAVVFSEGDVVHGVDWDRKVYKTFISVPVKAGLAQFGMLSTNSSEAGSIGGAQRAALLAMARGMAMVYAFDAGPQGLAVMQSPDGMSVSRSNVGPEEANDVTGSRAL